MFTHWIFDMDGTLTVPTHDFNAVRTEIDIPPGLPILEYLDGLEAGEAAWRHQRLEEIEWEHARRATADDSATIILERLKDKGVSLGIVTRNGLDIAHETLRASGLAEFFASEHVIARESAAPKPLPDGIQLLLHAWGAEPSKAVMVGDYIHDLEAGRSAGTATVHLDHSGTRPFLDHADYVIDRLGDLDSLI